MILIQALVEEFESTLEGYHNKGMEENPQLDQPKSTKSTGRITFYVYSIFYDLFQEFFHKSRVLWNDIFAVFFHLEKNENERPSDDSEEDIEDKENKTLPGGRKRKNRKKNRKTIKLTPVFSSEDEDFFD